MGKIFSSSTKQQIFQISLHLHKNWFTCQMDGADFKFEVDYSVNCYDVASLMPRQRCWCYVMTYSSYLLVDTRNGKPITYLLWLPTFITQASLLFETFEIWIFYICVIMGRNATLLWSLKFTLRCRLFAAIWICSKGKIDYFLF